VDYQLSVKSLVSWPVVCTLLAMVDPPQPSITVCFLGNPAISDSGSRVLRVWAGPALVPGTYLVKVQARSGAAVYTLEDTLVYAVSYFLGQAFPNPSHGSVTIPYGLPVEAPVSLEVYDVSGRRIRTLVSSKGKVGYQRVVWDGRAEGGGRAATGVYFYRLKAGNWAKTGKMVVVR
jgi:hypothetical protein